VLRSLLGGDRFVKWSTSGVSPLAAAASKIGNSTQISAFNYGYSDAGLFGVYAQSEHGTVAEAAKAAVASLKAASKVIPAEEFKRALAQAKFEAASRFETRASTTEILAAQAFQGQKVTASEALAALDSVQAADVSKVRKTPSNKRARILFIVLPILTLSLFNSFFSSPVSSPPSC
jgi:ubiquinol-cytochrome c reductase core subunit 2